MAAQSCFRFAQLWGEVINLLKDMAAKMEKEQEEDEEVYEKVACWCEVLDGGQRCPPPTGTGCHVHPALLFSPTPRSRGGENPPVNTFRPFPRGPGAPRARPRSSRGLRAHSSLPPPGAIALPES